jgi:hypothetical protein
MVMADARLNSVHLESPRRQEYRRAREVLLRACGSQTLFVARDLDGSQLHPTAIHRSDGTAKNESSCWLSDGEFLYPLQIGVNTLGRSSDNDIVLDDAYSSRRHCAIVIHSTDTAELHDTASKNGTLLNGKRITSPVLLKSGDEIRISERSFRFCTRSDEPNEHSPQATLSN